MRVLILNQSFYPDVVSAAQHAADLAAALAGAGHEVTVIAARTAYNDPSVVFSERQTWRGCDVRRVRGFSLGKGGKWRRILDSVSLLGAIFREIVRLPAFDVVVAMTHPPLVSFIAALGVWKGGRLVSWIMDLNPDEAILAGWLSERSPLARLAATALRFALRRSARIVVLDRFMRDRVAAKGVPEGNIAVVAPWSHDDAARFDPEGRERFRREHGLDGRFVVMYSGNLSVVHPIDTLLEAATHFRDRRDVVFCFVGDGAARAAVRDFASARSVNNVVCLPYQPRSGLAASLSAADLHVVLMGDAMVGVVHPCKIYNVLGLGIPCLHIGPAVNHIADLAADVRTPGAIYHVRHGDVATAVAAIENAMRRRSAPIAELSRAAGRFSQAALAPVFVSIVEAAGEAPPADVRRLELAAIEPAGRSLP